MKKFYYYARLNDNNICIEIVSRVTKLVDVVGYVEIPEYNETYIYRKYDNATQWSAETYEPNVDTVLQDKIEAFEGIVDGFVEDKNVLSNQITNLEGTIMELTMMLSMLQGGN